MQSEKNTADGIPGRPTKNRQSKIFEMIVKCFEDNLSAPAAANIAGVSRNTAYAYYKQITERFKQKQTADLFARQEDVRAQVIASFDKDIIQADEYLTQIEEQIQFYIKRKEEVPQYLFDQKLKAMKNKSSIKERKAAYQTKPTPRESADIEFEIQTEDGKQW